MRPYPPLLKIPFWGVYKIWLGAHKIPTKGEASNYQQLRFGVFREGVFQKMPALEGQFLKEISVRFAGENRLRTQKNTKQSSAQTFLNDPFPKTPFFSC